MPFTTTAPREAQPDAEARETVLAIRVLIHDPVLLDASGHHLWRRNTGDRTTRLSEADQLYTCLRYGTGSPPDYGFELVDVS